MFVITWVAVLALLFTLWLYTKQFGHFELSPEQSHWGMFGDFFGGTLNPLFAFLTLIAVLLALRTQREELELTRSELEGSTSALENQASLMVRQSFENMLFQMLGLHHEIVAQLETSDPYANGAPARGRHAFSALWGSFQTAAIGLHGSRGLDCDRGLFLATAYASFFEARGGDVGIYFRHLYRIFKFISDASLSDVEKASYAGIVRAQLTSIELQLLFYNGLAGVGAKFKPLLEAFAVFEHLPLDRRYFLEMDYDVPLYRQAAFGDQADQLRARFGSQP